MPYFSKCLHSWRLEENRKLGFQFSTLVNPEQRAASVFISKTAPTASIMLMQVKLLAMIYDRANPLSHHNARKIAFVKNVKDAQRNIVVAAHDHGGSIHHSKLAR